MPPRRAARRGHRFFLNPYAEYAFTRCPRCDRAPTKVRKVFLVIHVEPQLLLVLNKSCRLCLHCDLLIAKQQELEALMAYAVEQIKPELVGNDYLVVGTLDKEDGRQVKAGGQHPGWVAERTRIFREVLAFEPAPTWVLDPAAARSER